MSNCRKNNWPSDLETLINNQINKELYASHVYLSLYSCYMSDIFAYPGICNYLKKSIDEEREHAFKFIEYQNIRGGIVKITSLKQPNYNLDLNSTFVLDTFKIILDLEQSVYDSLLHIQTTSNDSALNDFLDEMLKEQLESQYDIGKKITVLERIKNDEHALYQFDKDLLN